MLLDFIGIHHVYMYIDACVCMCEC